MFYHLRPALVLLLLFTLLTGVAYPYAIIAIAGVLFPHQASGSLIERDGRIVGSELIGQNFTSERYFHGRPAATAVPYDATASGGTNLGPTSRALIDRVAGDSGRLHAENPGEPIPVDLITASASGLDPQISPAAAQFQVPRVARARGIGQDRLLSLIAQHTRYRWLGLFGEPAVNVLELNLALDEAQEASSPLHR
jgi:K+-transporting ATPase ATPase C chain